MQPFYASALQAWHNITPIQRPNLKSYDDLRNTPIQDFTLLNPHISGHSLIFDKMWSTLHYHYIGDLLQDNGEWKKIEHINKEQCTQPTIRRLATNLHTAETFFLRHYRYKTPPPFHSTQTSSYNNPTTT
jgi:hypothetical protein